MQDDATTTGYGPRQFPLSNSPNRVDTMVPPDPESSYSHSESPNDEEIASPTARAESVLPTVRVGRFLVLAMAAGLAAGAASWLAGELILDAYKNELNPRVKATLDAGDIRKFKEAQIASASRTFVLMGGILGLAMGLAGGLARRSPSAGSRSAILGLLLGAAVAGSTAFVVLPIFFKKYDPQSNELMLPLLTQGAIWSAVGAIGGLAFGLGLGGQGRWKATLVGGLVGAAAATVVYEIVGALAFATSKTDLPLSASITTRGIAQLLVAILTAVGAVVAANQSMSQKAASRNTPS
jgi:hypothetical protein